MTPDADADDRAGVTHTASVLKSWRPNPITSLSTRDETPTGQNSYLSKWHVLAFNGRIAEDCPAVYDKWISDDARQGARRETIETEAGERAGERQTAADGPRAGAV